MNVKLSVLSAGVLFFMGSQAVDAQKKDSLSKTQDIEEVVVLGYVKRSVSNSTGSSQAINSKKIENPAQSNVEAALQGQIAGVQASSVSGAPGAMQAIRVRGVGSFSASNRPLYVIDGIPVNDSNLSTNDNYTSMSPLAAIPSQDIESITVLKDASATAAYGARGSNGVIIITTKRGRTGKAKFTLSSNLGFQNEAFNKREMLNAEQRLMLLQEGVMNHFLTTSDKALEFITKNNLGGYNLWNAAGRPDTNWADLVRQKNALTHEHSLSVSGGTPGVKYYMSLNHNSTEPIVISRPYQRTSANIKLDATLNPKTKVETSLLLSKIDQDPILENGGYFGNPFMARYMVTPWYKGINDDGTPNINDIGKYTSIYNPLFLHKYDDRRNRILRSFATAKVEYKLLSNLTLANTVSLDYIFRDFKRFDNRFHGEGAKSEGSASRSHRHNVNFVNQTSLNWTKSINKHKFDVLGLFEYQKNQNNYLYGYGQSFPIDGLTNLASAGRNFEASSSYDDFLQTALLGMLNYSYSNRLVLDATFRREASSKFAPGHRYGNFWSVGFAYNLHRDVLKDVFDVLKLRGSYGTTGNAGIEINKYQDLAAFDNKYGENIASYPKNYANNYLTWEKNKTIDVGLDFAFLDKRFSGTIAYFNKLTYDLLQEVPLSRTTGFNQQLMNVGNMRNTGIEISLSYDIIRKENVSWNVYANFSTLNNKIVELAKDNYGKDLVLFPGSNSKGAEVGTSYGYWNLRKWAGVDEKTGAPKWFLNGIDGDTTSNWNEAQQANQGTSIPKFQGGFGTTLNVGPVFINALFTFQGGHKIYEEYTQFYMRTSSFTTQIYNGAAELLNRWQKEGDQTNVPKMNYSKNDNFYSASTRWLHDGDFIRLRNLQIGYNLKYDWLKHIGINGLSIQVTGTNLFTWVKDKNLKLDPETNANGYMTIATPPVKTIMTGIKINF